MKEQVKHKHTHHAKERFSQRTDFNRFEQLKNSDLAWKKGYKSSRFRGEFFVYLNKKQLAGPYFSIRVWNDYIYVFHNLSHSLVTLYQVPQRFLPIKKWLIRDDKYGGPVIIQLTAPDGEVSYISEGEVGGTSDDIAEAILFKTKRRAQNYLKNNWTVKLLRQQGYSVVMVDMA